MGGNLVRAGIWVSGGILLGRLAGFARESGIAGVYGLSTQADLVIAALSLPDLLMALLMGGGLSAALVPEFKGLDAAAARQLFRQVSILLGTAFLALALVAGFWAVQIAGWLAPGLPAASLQASAGLFRSTLMVLPLTAMAGAATAYLHAHERFAVPAMGTLIFNLAVVVALGVVALRGDVTAVGIIAVGVLAGGLLRLASQWLALPASEGVFALGDNRVHGELLRRYLQALLAGGLLFLMPVIGRAMASLEAPGALSAYNFAIRMVEFPLGVCITIWAVVLFPRFSSMAAAGASGREYGEYLSGVVLLTLVTSLSIAVPLVAFSRPVIDLLFGWGRLEAADVEYISGLLRIAALGLPAQGLVSLLGAALLARKDAASLLAVNALGVLVFVVLAELLRGSLGIRGVPGAAVIAYVLVVIGLLVALYRRHDVRLAGLLAAPGTVRAALLFIVAAIITGWLAGRFHWHEMTGSLLAGLVAVVLLFLSFALVPGLRAQWRRLRTQSP